MYIFNILKLMIKLETGKYGRILDGLSLEITMESSSVYELKDS